MKLYLYNDWHNGDLVTQRILVQQILAKHHDVELCLGNYCDRVYLFDDLPVLHRICPMREGCGFTLDKLCPAGYQPVNCWAGTFPAVDAVHHHNWAGLVETFRRQTGLSLDLEPVPMVAWPTASCAVPPRSVYVENGAVRSHHCQYDFDLNRLSSDFNRLNFLCTADPRSSQANVKNLSHLNLKQLGSTSEGCVAILGKGSGPFLCTYTEANRNKPRAVMQHRGPRFWEYQGNPLRYLDSEEQLYAFLKEIECTPT